MVDRSLWTAADIPALHGNRRRDECRNHELARDIVAHRRGGNRAIHDERIQSHGACANHDVADGDPQMRGPFMSLNTAVSHLATAVGPLFPVPSSVKPMRKDRSPIIG